MHARIARLAFVVVLLALARPSVAVSTACTGAPDGTACDDGDACTTNDVCLGGQCLIGSVGALALAPGSPITVPRNPDSLTAADFNRDGLLDLAVAHDFGVTVLLGEGNGRMSEAPGSPVATDLPDAVLASADVNLDDVPDLILGQCSPDVTILLGDGTGRFEESAFPPIDLDGCVKALAIADFDRDGFRDVAAAIWIDTSVSILLGDGAGRFDEAAGSPITLAGKPWDVTVADFNLDLNPDLAFASRDSDMAIVLLGDGVGGFAHAAGSPYAVGDSPYAIASADFNLDGKSDLAVASFWDSEMAVLLGNGGGGFSRATGSPVNLPNGAFSMVAADFNVDGKPDVVVAGCQPTMMMFLGDGTGGFTQAPTSVAVGSSCEKRVVAGEFGASPVVDFAVTLGTLGRANVLHSLPSYSNCDDGNPCTADSCNPAAGCGHAPIPEGGACDDGDRCTTGDTCDADGSCVSGAARNCDDTSRCTAERCDSLLGCEYEQTPGGACACERNGLCTAAHVASFRVVDRSGDHDTIPDTNETFDLYVSVKNHYLDQALTNVAVQIATDDPKIDCIPVPFTTIPELPAGATLESPVPFRIHVSPNADRAGAVPSASCSGGACTNGAGSCVVPADCVRTALGDYSARFDFTLASDQYGAQAERQSATIDLDLNVAQAADTTTTFAEGFESGLGAFVHQNLDYNIASNAASEGMRCQYSDPDYPNSMSYGETMCYLGFAAGQPTVNSWHRHTPAEPDGGRAFSGSYSAHFGIHSGFDPTLDSYEFSQMDALRTAAALNLAARVCSNDPAANPHACNADVDCVAFGGGSCVSASPQLSFKQQISLADSRFLGTDPGEAPDRAVVHAQIAGTAVWNKLYPYQNVYESTATDDFANCTFDPVDDGNDEDAYFDPSDPARRYGPSSTCKPELSFVHVGEPAIPFNASKVGRANDGPGVQGSVGPGTWVESRFDLSRYRGRPIRVRFLITTIKFLDYRNYQSALRITPLHGWYIDDVRVTQLLAGASPTVTTDAADNGGLPSCVCDPAGACDDGDSCTVDGCDPSLGCDHAPAPPPAEVTAVRFTEPPPDDQTIGWAPVPTATAYDVVRGSFAGWPVGPGDDDETCFGPVFGMTLGDPALPSEGYYYIVRARHGACAPGSWGAERATTTCP